MENNNNNEEEFLGDEIEVIEVDGDDLDWETDGETENENDNDDDEDDEGEYIIPLEHSDALHTFKNHTDAIYCCDILSDSNTVLTGGQDDYAYLWNGDTGDLIFKCDGHSETVSNVGFSHDGEYFATSDMDGSLQIWNTKTHEKVLTTEASSEIVWLKWHPNEHIIIAGTETGDVWKWNVSASEDLSVFPSHGSRTDCGAFLPDGLRVIVGYADGSVKTLNLKEGRTMHHFKNRKAHKGLVTVVDSYQNNILCASGSEDCTVKILNTKSNDVAATLQCYKHMDDFEENGVEALAFHSDPNEAVLVTGNLKGSIQIWDVARSALKIECDNESKVLKLLWHPSSPFLYSAGLDGIVRRWDSRNGEMTAKWIGHVDQINDMALNKNGTRLVTSSDDKTSCIFNTAF